MANSVSKTMVSGDTSADLGIAGFVINEQITLSTTPTGTSYSWGQSIPSGASTARTALNDDDAATATFTPDVAGVYVITCTVSGSMSYVIRIAVADVATVTMAQVARLQAVADASVPTPSAGTMCLYCSSTQSNALAVKKSDGSIHTITLTGV
jgi:hypothetical protein